VQNIIARAGYVTILLSCRGENWKGLELTLAGQ
jgi:hypothetical protein